MCLSLSHSITNFPSMKLLSSQVLRRWEWTVGTRKWLKLHYALAMKPNGVETRESFLFITLLFEEAGFQRRHKSRFLSKDPVYTVSDSFSIHCRDHFEKLLANKITLVRVSPRLLEITIVLAFNIMTRTTWKFRRSMDICV